MKKTFFTLLTMVVLFTGCDKDDNDEYNDPIPTIQSTVVKAAGNVDNLNPALAQFRAILGDPLNTTPNQAAGRREVNWDGVAAALTNNNNFPVDFFNNTDPAGPNGRKRGLLYLDASVPLRVDSSNFREINPGYEDELVPFSNKRSIIAANSIHSDVVFRLAGTTTDAAVKGFGIVFLDVDDANSTSLEFFNGNKNLGTFKAPARTNAGSFSFLGVHFPQEKITRVRIKAGSAVLSAVNNDISDGGSHDIVAFDDVFYDEPKANL